MPAEPRRARPRGRVARGRRVRDGRRDRAARRPPGRGAARRDGRRRSGSASSASSPCASSPPPGCQRRRHRPRPTRRRARAQRPALTAFARDDAGLEQAVARATGGLGPRRGAPLRVVVLVRPARARRRARPRPRPHRRRRRDARSTSTARRSTRRSSSCACRARTGPAATTATTRSAAATYPPGYVRWTEQRNMQAFLDLVAAGQLDPSRADDAPLPGRRAAEAYALLTGHAEDGARPSGSCSSTRSRPETLPRRVRATRRRAGHGRHGRRR